MPTAVMMTKTMKVLHLVDAKLDEDLAVFSREPDEPGDIPAVVELPVADWLDMGEPDVITVTVEPGDLLNG
jgi:hypothetical protein